MVKLFILKLGMALVLGTLCIVSFSYVSGNFFRSDWDKLSENEHSHSPAFVGTVFFDSENGMALTSIEILKTSNGGKTWESLYKNEYVNFNRFFFLNEQTGWVVGSMNKKAIILKTEDEGSHWQKIDFDENGLSELNDKFNRFFDICFNQSGKSWIAGDGGIVEAETDKQIWKISNVFPTEESIFSISCNKTGEVWAVGENSTIFHYRNSWLERKLDNSYLLTKVKTIGNDIWILGGLSSEGLLLRSQDSGESWEDKTPKSSNMLFDLSIEGNRGWLIGANGKIFSSGDSGNSWMESKSSTQNDLMQIFFLDKENVWVSGDKATILKYKN